MTQLDIAIGPKEFGRRVNRYRWVERDSGGAITRATEWTTAPPKLAPWRKQCAT